MELNIRDCPSIVDIAPIQDNQPRFDKIQQLNLDELAEKSISDNYTSGKIHESLGKEWKGDPASHMTIK